MECVLDIEECRDRRDRMHQGGDPAAASTAAPPRLCPTSSIGGMPAAVIASAAATRSLTLWLNPDAPKSPSLAPSAGKDRDRSTPMPAPASRREIRTAALLSFPQVKQYANSAYALVEPTGSSSRPDRRSPSPLGKSKGRIGIAISGRCWGPDPKLIGRV